jgi:hypothetical protein
LRLSMEEEKNDEKKEWFELFVSII